MRKFNKKQIVAISFPILLLLGIVITVVIPKGSILKALTDESLLVNIVSDGKEINGLRTKEDTANLQITAKETGIYMIPFDENESQLTFPKSNEEMIPHFESTVKDFDTTLLDPIATSQSTTSSNAESSEKLDPLAIPVVESAIYKVTDNNDRSKGNYYFKLKKNQQVSIDLRRESEKSFSVVVINHANSKEKQTLVDFIEEEKKDTTSSSQPTLINRLAEETSKNTSSTVQEKQQESEQKSEEAPVISSQPDVPTAVEDGKTILQAVTKPTSTNLEDLVKKDFKPGDSLIHPLLLTSDQLPKVESSNVDSELVAINGQVKTLDGTAEWDSDNNPGHDTNNHNDIVRSWDQITYNVSFAIQNMNPDVKYQNIKYQVTGTLPDAVQVGTDGKSPQLNGVIANGTLYNNDDNQPNPNATEGYSEGTVESSIPSIGQIIVPIVVNVMGAPNKHTLSPTFKLKIVSAEKVNADGSIEEVTMGDDYDSSDFSDFKPTAKTVSAKPSVAVKFVKGQGIQDKGSVTGEDLPLNSNGSARMQYYDAGIVTTLAPLSEHKNWGNKYVGSTFPKESIQYTIRYGVNYNDASNGEYSTNSWAMSVQGYTPAGRKQPWQRPTTGARGTTLNTSAFDNPLRVPNALSEKINTQPVETNPEESGVYNSGKFVVNNTNFNAASNSSTTTVTNTEFTPVANPYIYNLDGSLYTPLGEQPFSSLEVIFAVDNASIVGQGLANNWSSYKYYPIIDSITVDGEVQQNNTNLIFTHNITNKGSYVSGPTFLSEDASVNLDIENSNSGQNYGGAHLKPNQKITFGDFTMSSNTGVREVDKIFIFDPSALAVDDTRAPYSHNYGEINDSYQYGVLKSGQTPPYENYTVGTYINTYAKFDWYGSLADVPSGKKISAVDVKVKTDAYYPTPGSTSAPFISKIPMKVIQMEKGDVTPLGNKLTVLMATQFKDSSNNIVFDPVRDYPTNSNVNNGVFKPSTFSSTGEVTKNTTFYNFIGDSAWVTPLSISTETDVKESLYDIDDPVEIKVQGIMNGADTMDYDGAIKTTLPVGINYVSGTAVDGQGNPIPDPEVTTVGSGETLKQVLTWSISSTNSKVDIPNISMSSGTGLAEINFKASTNLYLLNKTPGFNSEGQTKSSLVVNTIGTLWQTGDPNNNDKSPDATRSSSDRFNMKFNQQVPFIKIGDKRAIDVGNKDLAQEDDGASMNDITYELTSTYRAVPENEDSLSATINMLDVLPYNGDGRGTKLAGSYSVQSVKLTLTDDQGNNLAIAPTEIKTAYSSEAPGTNYTINSDPNKLTGFTEVEKIPQDAKAILFKATGVPTGAIMKATIVLRPDSKQKAGDIFVNSANMNSNIDKFIKSDYIKTTVYGRDLTGVAWYDDDSDGLIGVTEGFAKDIAVKLYRTSTAIPEYKNELVKNSLTGQKFVDESENSLIKTDDQGKYSFENLPEGEYIAEFVIGDQVIQKKFTVTTPLVGDDPKLNSKADQTTFKTDSYDLPKISDLITNTTLSNSTYNVTDVNIGLVRISNSTIRLFKYEAGSAVDANSNGSLSDTEKSTGTPLAGATFDLYKGNDQTEKIGTATTDANGYLNFTGLALGDYNLVETKAPEGYELMKTPIKVSITEGNQTVMVYQDNEKTTELPHAGGNGPMVWLLGIASALGLAGLGALYHYYRHPGKKGA